MLSLTPEHVAIGGPRKACLCKATEDALTDRMLGHAEGRRT
jgi:hypothetical protein